MKGLAKGTGKGERGEAKTFSGIQGESGFGGVSRGHELTELARQFEVHAHQIAVRCSKGI